jgi:uncharacterized coiled-coil protein SlyX
MNLILQAIKSLFRKLESERAHWEEVNKVELNDSLDELNGSLDELRGSLDELNGSLDELHNSLDDVKTTADANMSATNPVGTGIFSMNRKAGSTVGDYSHAEGYSTTASGNYSHAAGYDTVASGENSHAEGRYTTASGNYSHAAGYGTTAYGENSHAEGRYTRASGTYSHAEGIYTVSPNESTHAQGEYNYTPEVMGLYRNSGNRQLNGKTDTVLTYSMSVDIDQKTGKISYRDPKESVFTSIPPNAYIIPDENAMRVWRTKAYASGSSSSLYISCTEYIAVLNEGRGLYAHVVGNGISDTERSNAHTLDWYGNAWFAGDVYVKSNSGTNKDEGSVKLATVDDIAALEARIVALETASTNVTP